MAAIPHRVLPVGSYPWRLDGLPGQIKPTQSCVSQLDNGQERPAIADVGKLLLGAAPDPMISRRRSNLYDTNLHSSYLYPLWR